MSGSSGNTASGAFEKPDRGDTLLNLTTCRRMLPLVRRIMNDIEMAHREVRRLQPELDRLDRQRRFLSWPERSRRYQVQEEITATDASLQQSLAELESLGLILANPEAGWVGFPTVVNGRKAFFSWKAGEETLKFWHFAGETVRRLIPPAWHTMDEVTLTGKS
jgi:hypothetical protein